MRQAFIQKNDEVKIKNTSIVRRGCGMGTPAPPYTCATFSAACFLLDLFSSLEKEVIPSELSVRRSGVAGRTYDSLGSSGSMSALSISVPECYIGRIGNIVDPRDCNMIN
jgi:hypothetical protein